MCRHALGKEQGLFLDEFSSYLDLFIFIFVCGYLPSFMYVLCTLGGKKMASGSLEHYSVVIVSYCVGAGLLTTEPSFQPFGILRSNFSGEKKVLEMRPLWQRDLACVWDRVQCIEGPVGRPEWLKSQEDWIQGQT